MNKLILLTTALLIGATDAANPRFRTVSTLAAKVTPDKEDDIVAKINKKIGFTLKNLMTAAKGKVIGGYSETQAKKACGHKDKITRAEPTCELTIFDKLYNGQNSDFSACNADNWKLMAPNMYGDDDTFPRCKTKGKMALVPDADLANACEQATKKKCAGTCADHSGQAILNWAEKSDPKGLTKMANYALGVYTTNNYVPMNSCLRDKKNGYKWVTNGNSENWGTPAPWQFVGNVYDQDKSTKGCDSNPKDDGKDFTCKHIAVMTACAVKGLAALPPFKGHVYRVDDFSADWAKELTTEIETTKVRSDLAFASTSSNDKYFKGHAAGFLKKCATHRSKYTLKASGSNCRDIKSYSAYPEEDEVLCLPNTKFVLKSSKSETFAEGTSGQGAQDCKGKAVTTWQFQEE